MRSSVIGRHPVYEHPTIDHPTIDIADAREQLGSQSFERGADYAESGRVLQWAWDSDDYLLCGTVVGSRGRSYAVAAQLADIGDQQVILDWSDCTCPLGGDCKHVAALLIDAAAAALTLPEDTEDTESASSWQLSLESLVPPAPQPRAGIVPMAIELAVTPAVAGRTQPTLTARLVRPGKRGGWVAGGLAWTKLDYPTHELAPEQLRVARQLIGAYRVSASSRPADRFSYHSYGYSNGYGELKEMPLSELDSGQLWPLLQEAARVGVRLVHTHPPLGDVRLCPPAVLLLDASVQQDTLTLTPVLRAATAPTAIADLSDAAPAVGGLKPLLFMGASGHGVVCADPATPQRLQLAPLARPAPEALQALALAGKPLRIPTAEIPRFLADYYPVLRNIAEIVSSDGTFAPPTIVGPELAVRADFRAGHEVEVTLDWTYRVRCDDGTPDEILRVPLTQSAPDRGIRNIAAETDLAVGIDAPLERFGLRGSDGALVDRCVHTGLATMQVATELLPLLDSIDGVVVERFGDPAEYREAGDSLVISVSADDIPGETDWFDLGVSISVEGATVPFVSVFSALAAGESHLLLPDGAYFSLDKPELVRLRTLIDEARALTDADDGPLRISRFQAGLFDELAALGVAARQAEQWQRQVAGLRSLATVEPAEIPQGVDATLRGYQAEGFSWLSTLYANGLGGILADDMGLGKTIQALALICQARESTPSAPPFLVLAPSSVVSNWAAEARRFTPDLRAVILPDTLRRSGIDLSEVNEFADVIVTSYTVFRLDFDHYTSQEWSGLILDEAQSVKNRQAKTYQCVRKLAAPFKLAITGTPMENNLMELWSLLSITAPGLFPNPTTFAEYFAKPIERRGDTERLDTFRHRIKPLVKRRTKELVAADLPAKQEQVIDVELHPRHRTLYDRQLQRERQKVLGMLDDVDRNRFTILKSLTTLRQLALHPGLTDPAEDSVPCAKLDLLAEHLRQVAAGGHRALVFSQFTRFLGRVRDRLDAEGVEYCYLDGRTRNRASVIERFKSGTAPVFLISLKAGGFGLNLTEADYCFLLDPWWNPATEAQAIDRTHRIGQTRNVMVYRMISSGTIEDKVVALNARKAKLFSSVIDDGNAFGGTLTVDDIRSLLD